MKALQLVCTTAAVIALAACNGDNSGTATGNASAPLTQIPPPAGGDWTKIVAATPAGGFIMGNPEAKVHLIEYASLTCPHCAEFDETGADPLINTYVKSGQVKYEVRNYVRDAVDLGATLIARCNGAAGFFPLARAFLKDQRNWAMKAQNAPVAQRQALESMPPNQIGLAAARLADLQTWAASRGVPEAKSTQCLTNADSVNKLVEMNTNAMQEYPQVPGTPTFILNGKMLENAGTWKALEPQLLGALG